MRNATPAQRKLGFQIHAVAFVLTLAVLVVLNVLIGPPYWVLWVVLGWSVGLLMHAIFGLRPMMSGGTPDRSS